MSAKVLTNRRLPPALGFGLLQGAPILALLWGVLAWREVKGSTQGVKMLLVGTVVLYVAGVALVSLGPVFAAK